MSAEYNHSELAKALPFSPDMIDNVKKALDLFECDCGETFDSVEELENHRDEDCEATH
jgi:hypothetical protein